MNVIPTSKVRPLKRNDFPSWNHNWQTIVVNGVYVIKKGKLEHAASILRRKRKAVFVTVGCVLSVATKVVVLYHVVVHSVVIGLGPIFVVRVWPRLGGQSTVTQRTLVWCRVAASNRLMLVASHPPRLGLRTTTESLGSCSSLSYCSANYFWSFLDA